MLTNNSRTILHSIGFSTVRKFIRQVHYLEKYLHTFTKMFARRMKIERYRLSRSLQSLDRMHVLEAKFHIVLYFYIVHVPINGTNKNTYSSKIVNLNTHMRRIVWLHEAPYEQSLLSLRSCTFNTTGRPLRLYI